MIIAGPQTASSHLHCCN